MIFRTECAWCGRTISEEPCTESANQLAINPDADVIITHGMCEECREKIEKNEFPQKGENDHV